jgi:hypothetical protein
VFDVAARCCGNAERIACGALIENTGDATAAQPHNGQQ